MKIERPKDWAEVCPRLIYDDGPRDMNAWFDEHVEPINKMLEGMSWHVFLDGSKIFGYKEEPIRQETCADVLREYIDKNHQCAIVGTCKLCSLETRAKAALEREK